MTTKPRGKLGKQSIRHGAYSYMTKLTLPDNRAYLRPYLSAVREGLIHDLGPTEEDLTTAQGLLIDRVIGQVGVIRLIEEYCKEEGILHGMFLHPILAENYGSFLNSLRLNLQALGINTRTGERILGPLELAAEIDAEKEAREAEKRPEVPQDERSPKDSPDTTGDSDASSGGENGERGGEDDG